MLGANQVESSFAEKDRRVLVGAKLNMSQQCALAAKKPDSLQGCIRSTASRLREVYSLLLQLWWGHRAPSDHQKVFLPFAGDWHRWFRQVVEAATPLEVFRSHPGVVLGCLPQVALSGHGNRTR